MPIIKIHLIDGRDAETKARLVAKVTDAVHETLGSPKDKIRIILSDMKPENYAIAGILVKDQSC